MNNGLWWAFTIHKYWYRFHWQSYAIRITINYDCKVLYVYIFLKKEIAAKEEKFD
jgi:hypothetical protein